MFDEIDQFIADSLPDGSYLHCLVNNAGVLGISADEKASPDFDPMTVPDLDGKVERVFQANVYGPLYCIQEFTKDDRL